MTQGNEPRRLRAGIIGAGRIARDAIAPAIHKARNAELFAAASRDVERAESLGPKRAYDSYSALLDDPEVEMVFITTHNGLHCELAIEAMRRGKHVLCEKPLAPSVAECERMVAESEQTGLRLMEAFMYRYHPQIAALQEVVNAGRLGALRHLEAAFHFDLTRTDDVRLVSAWGGGALLDVGCYCVNVARLFLGDSVSEITASARMHENRGVDMEVDATLRFESGATAELSCGFLGPMRQEVVLTGTAGVATLSAPFVTRTERPVLVVDSGGTRDRMQFDPVDAYQLEIEDFADAVLREREPILAADEGLKNARVLERIAAGVSACVPRRAFPS